jgi:DNA polymerase-1
MIKNRLVLIDAYALIFRAYYSIPPHFTDKLGNPTNAVYGFASALLTAIKELEPEYLAIGMDVGKSKHRDEYQEYKAHRPPAPDDLKTQVPVVKELAEAMNIPLFGVEGFEGEDVLATIVAQIQNSNIKNQNLGIESIIVTGDTDTFQLVSETTKVYIGARGGQQATLYDIQKIHERYGLTPQEFIDFKALKGDASDNIPGVKGIGEKTASSLIQKFHSLDNIYSNLEEIKGKVHDLLLEQKEMAYLSQRLATIQKDAPIDFRLEDAKVHDYDRSKVIELFKQLGFRSLIPRLHEEKRAQIKQVSLF